VGGLFVKLLGWDIIGGIYMIKEDYKSMKDGVIDEYVGRLKRHVDALKIVEGRKLEAKLAKAQKKYDFALLKAKANYEADCAHHKANYAKEVEPWEQEHKEAQVCFLARLGIKS
jgi:hypothetical protein